jgi:hypothetical protein
MTQSLPDKSHISLVLINNEKELQHYNVETIAQSLGNPLLRMYPIYLVFYKGSLRGYFQAIQQTCIYTTLHPELMNIREYLKITRSLITEIKRATGNPIFMLCDRALNSGKRVLQHVRLKRAEETAFVYDENAY